MKYKYSKEKAKKILEKYNKGGGVSLPVDKTISKQEIDSFIDYVNEYYGKKGIYADQLDGGFTKAELKKAVNKYISNLDKNSTWGYGDSLDRERVRQILQPSYKLYSEGGYAEKGVKVETLDEKIDLTEDGKVRARKTQEGKNLSYGELRERHGASPEALAFAKGGGVRKVGNREYSTGRNWTNDHNHVNKSEKHEVNYNRNSSFFFAEGGSIENQYEGKTPKEVWSMWTLKQREHFLLDHFNHFIVSEFKGKSLIEISKLEYNNLPTRVRLELDYHVNKGQYAMGGSLGNHGLKQGDQIIKTMSGGVQKVKTKSGDIVYVNLANGYRGAEPPLPFAKGGYTNERRHVNKSQDYEVRYAKNKPNRTGYLGKRSFDDGGLIEEFNPKSFSLAEIDEKLRDNDIYIQWLQMGDLNTSADKRDFLWTNTSSSTKWNKVKDLRLTISDYGLLELSKGSENLYLNFVVYEKDGYDPMNIQIYTKDNHAGLKQFTRQIVDKFEEGGFMTDPNFGDFQNGVYKYGGEVEYAIKGYKEYTEKLWKGDDYFSEKYAVNELAELELDLRKLNDGYLSPSKVVGKGYKNAKKVAQDWLNEQIKKQKSIIETRGLSNRTNQSNFRSELRFAFNQNMISEEKFNTLIDESNEIIDSLGETYANGGGVGEKYLVDGDRVLNTETNMYVDYDFETKERAEYFAKTKNDRIKKHGVDFATGGVTKNYINRNQLNTITIKKGNQKLTYKVSDVYNGAYKLEEGGNLEKTAFYVSKRNVVKVQLKNGKDVKVANGYWIKKGAKPIHTSKYDDGGMTEKEFMQKEINSQKEIEKGKVFKKYRVNVYENSFPFVDPLMTDNLVEAVSFAKKTIEEQRKYRASSKDLFAEISEFTPIEKRGNVRYPYYTIAYLSEEDLKSSKYEDGGQLEMKFLKGGKLESKIQKKVDEVNSLIEKAIDKDGDPIMVVDKSGTWEEPMQYKPIVYKNGRLYFEYYEPYSGKTQKEVVNKSNIEFDGYPMLLDIAKMYRSALKQKGVSFAGGGSTNKEIEINSEIEKIIEEIKSKGKYEKGKESVNAKGQKYRWDFYKLENPSSFLLKKIDSIQFKNYGQRTLSNSFDYRKLELKNNKDITIDRPTYKGQSSKFVTYRELVLLNKGGGKTTFKEKATAIAKNFEGKKVEPKYQKEYGKTYDKAEAKEVGNKIAGSQKAKYDSKMSGGGEIKIGDKIKVKASGVGEDYVVVEGIDAKNEVLTKKDNPNAYLSVRDSKGYLWEIYLKEVIEFPSKTKSVKGGSTKRGGAMVLAKQIRKDGESWASALKRANEQMKKK